MNLGAFYSLSVESIIVLYCKWPVTLRTCIYPGNLAAVYIMSIEDSRTFRLKF